MVLMASTSVSKTEGPGSSPGAPATSVDEVVGRGMEKGRS